MSEERIILCCIHNNQIQSILPHGTTESTLTVALIQTLQVLTAALRKFEGSVVVISHDRQFLEELEPTHVVTVRYVPILQILTKK